MRNTTIMLAAGFAASIFCTTVYGADLPTQQPPQASTQIASSPKADKADDAAAAAALRALLANQRPSSLGGIDKGGLR